MSQHEILEPLPLHDASGQLSEVGWARQPYWQYQRRQVPAPAWRIKEWDCYTLVSPQGFALSLSASNLGYAGVYELCFVDLQRQRCWQMDARQAFPPGRHALPESPTSGSIRFRHKHLQLSLQRSGQDHRLQFASTQMQGPQGRGLDGELYFHQPPRQESLNIVSPWADRRGAFHYNSSFNCLPVSGQFRLGSQRFRLDPNRDLGALDWGRGVWPWRSHWYRASASGFIEGQRFGLNLGYGFADHSLASANLLLFDGMAHKLDQVRFEFDPQNRLKPWQISDNQGRLELDFTPRVDRHSRLELLLVANCQHQLFGHYRGKVTLDDGRVLLIKQLPGFAEDVRKRW